MSARGGVWLWNVIVYLTGGLPTGSSKDHNTAKAEFKTAWKALKARTPPKQLAAACKAFGTTTAEGRAAALEYRRTTRPSRRVRLWITMR
jgi:hypothetical protein